MVGFGFKGYKISSYLGILGWFPGFLDLLGVSFPTASGQDLLEHFGKGNSLLMYISVDFLIFMACYY